MTDDSPEITAAVPRDADGFRAPAGWRGQLYRLVEDTTFNNVIIAIIIANAIVLGMQTSDALMTRFGVVLEGLDGVFLDIFVVELCLRLIAYGSSFARRPWSVFDFVVVAVALIPGAGAFTVIRAMRVLRALRLISQVKAMRVVVEALMQAIPGLGSTAVLLLLIYYVCGVMATFLFKNDFPQFFGTLGGSMYSLFQIMTLESWSAGIVRPVMQIYPYAWAFFVPFVILTSLMVLNLVVAVVVDSMQAAKDSLNAEIADEDDREPTLTELHHELRALRQEVAALKQQGESAI